MIDASLGSLAVLFVGLAIGTALARRQRSDTRFVALVFVLAFLLRATAAVAIHFVQLQTEGTGALFQDDYTNDLVARWLLRIERGEPVSVFLGHEHLLADSYVYVLTVLYRLVGHDPLAAKLLSAFFGALMVIVAHDLALMLAGQAAARLTALLTAAFPSLVLWTSLPVKEGLILLLSLVLLRAIVVAAHGTRQVSVSSIAWLGVAAVLLGSLRLPVIGVLVPLIPLATISRILTQPVAARVPIRPIVTVLLLLSLGIGVATMSPPGRTYLQQGQLVRLAEQIQLKRTLMGERGRTSLLAPDLREREVVEARPADTWSILGYLPKGLKDALLAPFPWTAQTVKDRLLALEMIAWYALLGAALLGGAGLWRTRRAELLMLAAYLGANLLILALFDTNLGTLARHRTALYAPTFILASVGLAGLLGRHMLLVARPERDPTTVLEAAKH